MKGLSIVEMAAATATLSRGRISPALAAQAIKYQLRELVDGRRTSMTKKENKVETTFQGVSMESVEPGFSAVGHTSRCFTVQREEHMIKLGSTYDVGGFHFRADTWEELKALIDETNAHYEELAVAEPE